MVSVYSFVSDSVGWDCRTFTLSGWFLQQRNHSGEKIDTGTRYNEVYSNHEIIFLVIFRSFLIISSSSSVLLRYFVVIFRLFSVIFKSFLIQLRYFPVILQPSLTEIRDTITSFNLFICDLGHVISIFFMPKAQISNIMTAFGHPFLLSPLILRNCDNSRIYTILLRVPDHE